MKVLTVGGGSGGHVTPVLAVIEQLRVQVPKETALDVYFLTDRQFGDRSKKIMAVSTVPVISATIFGGKLRRYHGVSLMRQLLDVPTVLSNIRDVVYIGIGALQSIYYIAKWKPDVVFSKGGFVCLPVGIVASRIFKIPLVIHDSDAVAGLTNRLLAPHATAIATGAPLDNYSYPQSKSHYVGIPIHEDFVPYDHSRRTAAKRTLGVSDKPMIAVTGGGLGARRLNDAIIDIAPRLLTAGYSLFHITGTDDFVRCEHAHEQHPDYKLVPFVHSDMATVLGAADVVVSRAGATTLLELAGLGAATVIVPNDMLPGGHQTKNAAVYEQARAAIVVKESDIEAEGTDVLLLALDDLMTKTDVIEALRGRMHTFAKPDAAADTARLILLAVQPSRS